MINEPKTSKGIYDFSDEIKETSIRKHYDKPKPLTETMKSTVGFVFIKILQDSCCLILYSIFISFILINAL